MFFLPVPLSLPISLLVLALANYLFSFPIYRYRKQLGRYKEGIRPERPNPFYAVRVLILARASVLAGALFAGWHVGVIIWLVSFSVAPENLMLTSSFGSSWRRSLNNRWIGFAVELQNATEF